MNFLKSRILVGLYVLLPLMLMWIGLREIGGLLATMAEPIADMFPSKYFDDLKWPGVVAILLIVGTSFVIGLAAMLNFIIEATLTIPMFQLILLMLLSTISLLLGKLKLALVINYLFTLHWAYMANQDKLMEMGFENFKIISMIYFIFGLWIVMVAVFAFMYQKNE